MPALPALCPSFDLGRFAGAPPRVLVADDDEPVRRGVAMTLRRRGFRVDETENGGEILDAIGRIARGRTLGSDEALDLVITDVKMPKIGGLEVLEFLASSQWDVPVIVMSGLVDARIRERAARLRAAVVLDKPFNAQKLLAAVAALVPIPGLDNIG